MATAETAPLRVPATASEVALANKIIAQIDRRYTALFTRAGDQKYTELDSDKDPFTDAVDGSKTEGTDYVINTDGKFEWTSTIRDSGKNSQAHFKVTGYNYVIKKNMVRDAKGKIILVNQEITCKSYRLKALCMHMLGIPLS